jgi:hypothetical protein
MRRRKERSFHISRALEHAFNAPSALCVEHLSPDCAIVMPLRYTICMCASLFTASGPGVTRNRAAGLPAWDRILVLPSVTSHLLYELLGRVRLRFLMVSPFRIACEFLHL